MMNINPIQPAIPPQGVDHVGAISPERAAQPMNVSDVVEISEVARLASQLAEVPAVRAELVERVKSEIASGVYETSDKLDVAIDRLMEELA